MVDRWPLTGRGESFAYPTFERAILTCLRELDPANVLGRPEGPADADVIEGERSWVPVVEPSNQQVLGVLTRNGCHAY